MDAWVITSQTINDFEKNSKTKFPKFYFSFFKLFFYIINLFNIIQHSIAINFTITGRQKKGGQNVEKKQKKQAKKAEYESSTD